MQLLDERRVLDAVLGGTMSVGQASQALGVHRTTLWRRIKRMREGLGLEPAEPKRMSPVRQQLREEICLRYSEEEHTSVKAFWAAHRKELEGKLPYTNAVAVVARPKLPAGLPSARCRAQRVCRRAALLDRSAASIRWRGAALGCSSGLFLKEGAGRVEQ